MKPNLGGRKSRLILITFLTLACCGISFAADTYTLIEIKGAANNSSLGRHADNLANMVVGSSGLTHGSDTHAFVWTAQQGMLDLGTLPGGEYSEGFAVNGSGFVVGDSNGGKSVHAFVCPHKGGMH